MPIHIAKKYQLKGHRAAVYAIGSYKEKESFLSAGGDGWVALWEHDKFPDGQLLAKVKGNIFALCYLPQTHQLVLGNMYGGVHWVDLNTNTNTKNTLVHSKGVYGLLAVDDFLYSLGGQGGLTKWSIEQQKPLESLQLSNEALRSVAYFPERKQVAIGASDNRIYILEIPSLRIVKTIYEAHENSVFSVAYTPDFRYLISGGRDAHLKVWDIEADYTKVKDLSAHWFTVNCVAPHPTAPIVATASRDKTIRFWKMDEFKLMGTVETIEHGGHPNSVNNLRWINDGKSLVSCSDDRTLIVWDVDWD